MHLNPPEPKSRRLKKQPKNEKAGIDNVRAGLLKADVDFAKIRRSLT